MTDLPAPGTVAPGAAAALRRPPRRPSPSLWLLALALTLPELVLLGADHGLWGSALWRPVAYSLFGFWSGLLHGWQPNYALQPAAMFVTYGFLHAGWGHLGGNLLALAWLGPPALRRAGTAGFWAVWAAAWLGGALAFGLISTQPVPMVGASGGLFGLAGALTVLAARRPSGKRLPARGLGRALAEGLALAAANLAAFVLLDGQLAWETHLGGFLAGAAVALVLRVPAPRGETGPGA